MSASRSILDHTIELADAALDRPPGTALLSQTGRMPVELAAPTHRYGALVGFTCPRSVDAVAAVHEAVLSTGPEPDEPGPHRGRSRHEPPRDVRVAVAVARSGLNVARVRDPDRSIRSLDRLEGPLVDVARRALRLDTPPCSRPPLALFDAAFVDHVLSRLLDADLGHRRPSWAEIGSAHPLARSSPISPAELRDRRHDLIAISWLDVRQRIISQGGPPDLELTPGLAEWLDTGALARWLFARYPEPSQMRRDVCELLDPVTARSLRVALAPL